jgi:hypothetical protein
VPRTVIFLVSWRKTGRSGGTSLRRDFGQLFLHFLPLTSKSAIYADPPSGSHLGKFFGALLTLIYLMFVSGTYFQWSYILLISLILRSILSCGCFFLCLHPLCEKIIRSAMGQVDDIHPAAVGDEKSSATSPDGQALKGAIEPNSDVEKLVVGQAPTLKRKLKSRHLQMIAIGTFMRQCILWLKLMCHRWNDRHGSFHW